MLSGRQWLGIGWAPWRGGRVPPPPSNASLLPPLPTIDPEAQSQAQPEPELEPPILVRAMHAGFAMHSGSTVHVGYVAVHAGCSVHASAFAVMLNGLVKAGELQPSNDSPPTPKGTYTMPSSPLCCTCEDGGTIASVGP